MMDEFGLLIVDKPVGPTSHQIVNTVRRLTGIRKVGHAGTLDPRATGVLVLCLGPATRLSEYLTADSKHYQAEIEFGSATNTYDADGEMESETGRSPLLEEITAVLPEFLGQIQQMPPPFSAIKVKGRKAYDLARKGEEVALSPRQVTIYALEIDEYHPPLLKLSISCSAGTYIRSIAHDLGVQLGTGAFLSALRRTKSGSFSLEDAVPFGELEALIKVGKWHNLIVPAAEALPEFEPVPVDFEKVEMLKFGKSIAYDGELAGLAKAIDANGILVAILEAGEGNSLHPKKVFLN